MWTEVLEQLHQDIVKRMKNGGVFSFVDVEVVATVENRIDILLKLCGNKIEKWGIKGNAIAFLEFPSFAPLSLEDAGYLLNEVLAITNTLELVWDWKEIETTNTLHLYLIVEV